MIVDGSGLSICLNRLERGWRIDYRKLRLALERETARTILDSDYYGSFVDGGMTQREPFLRYLRSCGFRVDLVALGPRIDGRVPIEKGVDAKIVIAATNAAREGRDVVLVSHDADFCPALLEVRRLGRVTFVAGFKREMSMDLARTADRWIRLEDLAGEIRVFESSLEAPPSRPIGPDGGAAL